MNNPFEIIDARLSNIESLLLDIKHDMKREILVSIEEIKNVKPKIPITQRPLK